MTPPTIDLPRPILYTCQHPGCPKQFSQQPGRPDRPPPGWYVRWQGKLVVLCPEHAPK
jgi:hypothetical protein